MSLRDLERSSIRAFLETNADKLTGTVMDWGCGLSPYRDIVDAAGGAYRGWDSPGHPGSVVEEDVGEPWGRHNAMICTQVIQYVEHPADLLFDLRFRLREDGWLLMTGPTNWPVVEAADKWRFTTVGVVSLLQDAGFHVQSAQTRAHITHEGEKWSIGWEAVAQA